MAEQTRSSSRRKLTARAVFPFTLVLSVVLQCELAQAGTTTYPGGSNLAHYDLGANKGVVYNYCVANQGNCGPYGAQATIDSDLQTMRNNGQYRLRIPIFHARGNNNGATMDSAGGNLSLQHRTNLQNLLATVKLKGFSEVIISFHPQDYNLPAGGNHDWSGSANDWNNQPPGSPMGTTYSNLYQENFNLILNLRTIIIAAQIAYKIDLGNELAPPTSDIMNTQQGLWAYYVRRMWMDYNIATGQKSDTLSFSLVTPFRVFGLIDTLNGTGYGQSNVYDVHIYENYQYNPYGDSYAQYTAYHANFNNRSFAGPLIIGECYYNDVVSAQKLKNAILATPSRTVLFLLQWPVQWIDPFGDAGVAKVYQVYNYAANGFFW